MGEESSPALTPIKDIPWSVLIALILNLVAGVWFASGLEQRVQRVENKQIEEATDIRRLDQAREEGGLHMSKIDDHEKSVDDKLTAILTILQQDQGPDPGVGTPAPAQNFTKSPSHR